MRDTSKAKGEGLATYYTMGELANFLGVSRQSVKNWYNRGLLPQPLARTHFGWALWSPAQAQEILQNHLTRLRKLGKVKT